MLDKMKRQRNIVKKKEQGKNPQDKIKKGELVKLCEKQFREIISKIIQNLENTMKKCKKHLTHLIRAWNK